MQMREKVGKSRNTVFFQWFAAPEGRKVGSLKRRVRSQLARWDMKKCAPLWREAHFQVKMDKTLEERTTFGSWDVGKVHAVVARSTFPSQNVQNTPMSDHFWKLRCRKSACRCGAKHISKSKCTNNHMFEVKMLKNVKNTRGSDHLEVQMSLRFASPHYTALHYTSLHYTTTLHSTTLHYTKLHYTTLHDTTLHYRTLPSTTLHYITLHYTPLHYNYNYDYTTTLHYTPLH